jgi:hypothetical protein
MLTNLKSCALLWNKACEMVFINVNMLCVTPVKATGLSTPGWVTGIKYLC